MNSIRRGVTMAAGRTPTHEDAQLVLKLYELRREERMREARDWFVFKFFPESYDDIKAVLSPDNPHNAHFRMFTSYWGMAASFVTRGILDGELLLDSSGEMIMMWAKLEEFAPEMRAQFNMPDLFKDVESVVTSVPWAADRARALKEQLKAYREQMKQMNQG
jgi:hypothetical protein